MLTLESNQFVKLDFSMFETLLYHVIFAVLLLTVYVHISPAVSIFKLWEGVLI